MYSYDNYGNQDRPLLKSLTNDLIKSHGKYQTDQALSKEINDLCDGIIKSTYPYPGAEMFQLREVLHFLEKDKASRIDLKLQKLTAGLNFSYISLNESRWPNFWNKYTEIIALFPEDAQDPSLFNSVSSLLYSLLQYGDNTLASAAEELRVIISDADQNDRKKTFTDILSLMGGLGRDLGGNSGILSILKRMEKDDRKHVIAMANLFAFKNYSIIDREVLLRAIQETSKEEREEVIPMVLDLIPEGMWGFGIADILRAYKKIEKNGRKDVAEKAKPMITKGMIYKDVLGILEAVQSGNVSEAEKIKASIKTYSSYPKNNNDDWIEEVYGK